MITRVTFGDEFLEAICHRGLTLSDVARRAGVSLATVSAAVHHRPVNVRTALHLARAVATEPVIAELEAWTHTPKPGPTVSPSPQAVRVVGSSDADGRPRSSSTRRRSAVPRDQLRIELP